MHFFNTSSAPEQSAIFAIFPTGVTREPGNKEKKEPQVTQALEGQLITAKRFPRRQCFLTNHGSALIFVELTRLGFTWGYAIRCFCWRVKGKSRKKRLLPAGYRVRKNGDNKITRNKNLA